MPFGLGTASLLWSLPLRRLRVSFSGVYKMAAVEEVIAQLRARVAELEEQVRRDGPRREKVEEMSSEVVDSNPYRQVGNILTRGTLTLCDTNYC